MYLKTLVSVCVMALLVVGLGGCGGFNQAMKSDAAKPAAVDKKVQPAPAPDASKKAAEPKKDATPAAAKPADPAKPVASSSPMVLKDIHFDFDKYVVKPSEAELLNQNYLWLKANSKGRLRIEGNCDEKGTVEYNMTLGQKRADAAKSFLMNLGVETKRIETVSYGKEKPLDPAHTEDAWAKNRRDHFVPIQ